MSLRACASRVGASQLPVPSAPVSQWSAPRARLTVRPPLSSLPGSTGLVSLAPFSCAQPLQLSGNSGCRQGSAAPAGLPSAHQLFAAAAAAHSRASQLLASAGLLVRGPPISPAPARLQLFASSSPPPAVGLVCVSVQISFDLSALPSKQSRGIHPASAPHSLQQLSRPLPDGVSRELQCPAYVNTALQPRISAHSGPQLATRRLAFPSQHLPPNPPRYC